VTSVASATGFVGRARAGSGEITPAPRRTAAPTGPSPEQPIAPRRNTNEYGGDGNAG
jgi:hypothetical protein